MEAMRAGQILCDRLVSCDRNRLAQVAVLKEVPPQLQKGEYQEGSMWGVDRFTRRCLSSPPSMSAGLLWHCPRPRWPLSRELGEFLADLSRLKDQSSREARTV